MKKFFTLLLSSLFSLSLLAFDNSHLSIFRVNNHLKLKIEVDGQRVMMQGNSITLTNLSEGNHNVRVYREKRKDIFDNRFSRGYEIIYATSVYLGRAYQVDITINEYGTVFMDSYRIETNNDSYTGSNAGYGLEGDNGYSNVMSAGEFDQVKEQICKEWFEPNKLISVKTIIDKNNFTTQQVYDLMLLFTVESNRLEVSKYAYCNTVDKQNYYRLKDALTFSSSKDELARFIHESH
ncbi:MAG TPA: DUF4476 domain-containing protein [Chitinophagaceae bacterium]